MALKPCAVARGTGAPEHDNNLESVDAAIRLANDRSRGGEFSEGKRSLRQYLAGLTACLWLGMDERKCARRRAGLCQLGRIQGLPARRSIHLEKAVPGTSQRGYRYLRGGAQGDWEALTHR